MPTRSDFALMKHNLRLPACNIQHILQILLPSAVHLEERLTVSQAVPEPGQQSVRQKHTVWVFCQWQTRPQAVGTPLS